MKGQKSIYQSLLETDSAVSKSTTSQKSKGRSEALKLMQDEFIVCRYYWYVKLKDEKYEATLGNLQAEVFLSVMTITKIIIRESAHLKMLQQSKPDIKYFQKKYPFFQW